jgi:hypothetical protein
MVVLFVKRNEYATEVPMHADPEVDIGTREIPAFGSAETNDTAKKAVLRMKKRGMISFVFIRLYLLMHNDLGIYPYCINDRAYEYVLIINYCNGRLISFIPYINFLWFYLVIPRVYSSSVIFSIINTITLRYHICLLCQGWGLCY